MKHLQQYRQTFPSLSKIIAHIPLELSLGLGAVTILSVMLGLLVWNFDTSGIRPDMAAWLMRRTALIVAFVLLLGWSATHQSLFDRFRLQAIWVKLIMFGCYFGLLMTLYSHFVTLVFSLAQVTWVTKVSLWYLRLDVDWGVYERLDSVIWFFTTHDFWLGVVSKTYDYTLYVSLLSIFIVALFSAHLARQFFIATIASVLLSSTLWLALPAIAPYQLATTDSLAESGLTSEIALRTTPVVELYAAHSGTSWATSVADYSDYWDSVATFFGYAVSSNPSMHVIWGLLMTVYLWRSHWLLGSLAAVFAGLETIGAMLFLQHYLIDIPGGVVFGVVAICMTARLAKFEADALSVDRSFWFYPLVLLERMGKWLVADWRRQKEIMGW